MGDTRRLETRVLDTVFSVSTPEGIELHLRAAGPVPRALAWLLDLLWRLAVLVALSIALGQMKALGLGVFLLVMFALEWLVPAWCEARWAGATPGKKALGLKVVSDDGAPITLAAALTRNLLRFADFLPFLYLGGLLAMMSNREFKRLGDFVAGTIVVYATSTLETRAIPAAEPMLPPRPLSLDEARTVLDFVERVPALGPARAEELAAIAQPWLPADRGTPLAQLTAVANHLVGHAPD